MLLYSMSQFDITIQNPACVLTYSVLYLIWSILTECLEHAKKNQDYLMRVPKPSALNTKIQLHLCESLVAYNNVLTISVRCQHVPGG